jgi:transposase
MNITTVGIDLAKNVFQVHGVDERGKVVLRKALKRAEVTKLFSTLPACLVGMEACGGAHYWARQLMGLGHTVKLMAPQFVKPYVKTNKNDARDAEAICEAVTRPSMRFVPVKDVENGLPEISRSLFARLFDHFRALSNQVRELESQIKAWHKRCTASERIEAIPGIGALTASALVASIGDAKTFKSGRQLAAWLGLVPRQDSSGGKEKLLGINGTNHFCIAQA